MNNQFTHAFIFLLFVILGCTDSKKTLYSPLNIGIKELSTSLTTDSFATYNQHALVVNHIEKKNYSYSFCWPIKVIGKSASLTFDSSSKGPIIWILMTNKPENNVNITESPQFKKEYAKYFYTPNEKDFDELNDSLVKIFGTPKEYFRPKLDSNYNLPFGMFHSNWDFDSLRINLSYSFGIDSSISLMIIKGK